jgi:nitrite reductase/ring-hydroxylating ferredoxin subunit
MELERRTVLQVGGLVAVGGALAACGGSASSSSAASAAPAGGAQASGGGGIAVADIPVGGGVIDAKTQVVVTQPEAGTFKAFTAICPHQGCTVGSVENNEIICPCHGSKFSAQDGSVIQGPANSPLASAGVTVSNGQVVING